MHVYMRVESRQFGCVGLRPGMPGRGARDRLPKERLMSNAPLMPKATAVWLVENTSLSFDQIADFCKLHPLEGKAIADGDSAQGIKGLDPVQANQITREQITEAEADPTIKLALSAPTVSLSG